jgi:hypothetical protein
MEPENLLPCSQNTVIRFYPEAVHILIIYLTFVLILSFHLHLSPLAVLSFQVFRLKSLCEFLLKFRMLYLFNFLSNKSFVAISSALISSP